MNKIEFFFDPVCPFAWLTSRWASEVSEQTDLEIEWRFISLRFVNEHSDIGPAYSRSHGFGLELLRIAAAVREAHGNAGVAAAYTAFGTELHVEGGSKRVMADESGATDALIADALAAAGLDETFAKAADDDSHDSWIRSDTDLALLRSGPDVGTPIITFDLERPESSTFFGPVINRVPRGAEAVQLWDALSTIARLPGFSELKRSIRGELDFS